MSPGQLIAMLNSINVGEVDLLSGKLDEARAACVGLGRDDLADLLSEAREKLSEGDLRTYRRRIETVVSRLGHLR